MDRKDFLKISCNACLLGGAAMLIGITGCSPGYGVFKTSVVNNLIAVPLSIFEKGNLQVIRASGWQYDIAVQKNTDGSYTALLMQCTHMDNQLTPSQNGYSCSLHGSRFSNAGRAIKGPAEKPLKKYKTSIDNNNLIIST